VPAAATQEQLRQAFRQWGLPGAIRVDNGTPWGSAGDCPTDLALWLIGLGVELIWIPPRCPQNNGVVERSQGTGKRWAEPATCADAGELQRRVDEQDRIQRELYQSVGGLSRLEAYPSLKHSTRSYSAKNEAAQWDIKRVIEHLARYVMVRRVDCKGIVSLYNKNRYVGRKLSGQDVYVSLDPVKVEWVYSSRDGVCYHRQEADELTAERVMRLEVSHHRIRPKPPRRTRVSLSPANHAVG
jgi:transposase InsO family protein